MAYDEFLGERISKILAEMNCTHSSKKMMGGLCFLVDDKMLCGIHFDKKKQTDLLMARVGVDQYEEALTKEFSHPMDFTGRVMKGYVFVEPEGFDMDEDLTYWLELCIAYNPLAKSSKKKKAKKT